MVVGWNGFIDLHSSHPFLLRRLHACYLVHLPDASSSFPATPFSSSSLPSPSLPLDCFFFFFFSVCFSTFTELMGAVVAKYLTEHGASSSSSSSPLKSQFGDLPESCISEIFMYLDPPDVCKLARLNRASRSASFADFVWESKLPSNYKFLVKKFGDGDADYVGKKDVYARLCRPNRFDSGKKEFWLEKSSGKIFLAISSKALKITGIDDRRYWNYIPSEESRFQSVAYLKQIWWVEILGELEFEFPPGSYSVYFRLQLGKTSRRFGRRVAELDEVHGWDIKPVRFQLSASNGQNAISECYLDQFGNWVDYLVGDFTVDNPHALLKIKFSMIQIDCTHTKGGLCVDSVFIRPKIGGERLK